MRRTDNLVILTGAGVSAESGLSTFRAADGLWEGHRVEDVASPEGFARDPGLVHRFYNARRAQIDTVAPNAAHVALAQLETGWGGDFLLVTQNIDDLHERAGSKRMIHMHGEGRRGWCLACGARFAWDGAMSSASACPRCDEAGQVRPDIVWFGELPYQMDAIEAALMECDLFVSIGTSGAVYPAAGFVQTAKYRGARTVEINLEPSQGSLFFDERRFGPASVEVPAWVEERLAPLPPSWGGAGGGCRQRRLASLAPTPQSPPLKGGEAFNPPNPIRCPCRARDPRPTSG